MSGPASSDFITGEEIADELDALLERADALKVGRPRTGAGALAGKSVALIFEQPSTRTRVSFEVGVAELGGTPVILRSDELQMSRGESIADVGRVMSRYVHAIVIRSRSHERVVELADAADMPVVNALTPVHHPCQAIADLQTLRERFGSLDGLRVAFVGDGNNVARSLARLGSRAGVEVVVCSPPGFELEADAGAELVGDPREAVAGADAVYTDVWISMGEERRRGQARGPCRPTESTTSSSLSPPNARSSSTACRPTPARRSPPTSSTAPARPSSSRQRTASTPRRPCSRCCSASGREDPSASRGRRARVDCLSKGPVV